MQDLEALNLLINRASAIAGNDNQLAKSLKITRQKISDMRAGRQTATPEDQALFAAVAGLDPIQTLARAMVQKHEGTTKGDLLYKALGKALLATGAALGSAGASAHQIFGTMGDQIGHFIRCIKRRRLVRYMEC